VIETVISAGIILWVFFVIIIPIIRYLLAALGVFILACCVAYVWLRERELRFMAFLAVCFVWTIVTQ
jgi:hypothetical protein